CLPVEPLQLLDPRAHPRGLLGQRLGGLLVLPQTRILQLGLEPGQPRLEPGKVKDAPSAAARAGRGPRREPSAREGTQEWTERSSSQMSSRRGPIRRQGEGAGEDRSERTRST